MISIAAAVAVVFSPLFFAGFTSWDDYQWVARNWRLNPPTFASLVDYWTRPFMDLYVPVAQTVWWLLAAVSRGRDPVAPLPAWVFHTANVIVHAANAGLVYALLRRWLGGRRRAAFVGATVFALHPVQVEAVAWVSGLKDLLFGSFALLALAAYTRSGEGLRRRRGFAYAAGTAAFVLAMLCKPTAVVVPGMALVVEWLVLDRPARQSLSRIAPWVVLAVPCLIWTRLAQPAHLTVPPPMWERPLVAADAVAFYLGKLAVPLGLAIDYGRTPAAVRASGALYWTWVVPICVGAITLLTPAVLRRRFMAAAGLFLLPLSPVLGLVPFDFQAISTVADHYLYLPMLGVSLAVAVAAGRWPRLAWVAALALPLMAGLSMRQCLFWRDNASLFGHTLAVNPRSWAAHDSLAAASLEAGDYPAVERHARASLAIDPNDTAATVHLAAAMERTGRERASLRLLRDAAARDPQSAPAAVELGSLLAQLNDPDAEAALRRAIALAPDHPAPPLNLGTLLLSHGQPAEALSYLERAVRLGPRDPRARTNLAVALATLGRTPEAVGQLREALRIDPAFAPAREALATLSGPAGQGGR